MVFDVWHDIHENGLQKYQKHIQLCRFFIWITVKVENGELRMLCFAVVFLVFWSTLPVFWSKMGPVPENLQFRVIFHRGLGRKILWSRLQNHQHSLGFNWYFACGDDGKLDSKSTKIRLVFYVGLPLLFRRAQESGRRSINKPLIRLISATFRGIRWNLYGNT